MLRRITSAATKKQQRVALPKFVFVQHQASQAFKRAQEISRTQVRHFARNNGYLLNNNHQLSKQEQQQAVSEYDLIMNNFAEAASLFKRSQFADTEECYEQLFDMLYSADVMAFPALSSASSAPFEAEFNTLIKHLTEMSAEGHVLSRIPLYKAHWAIAGIYQQMNFLEHAKRSIDEALALAIMIEDANEQKSVLPLLKITKGSILFALKKPEEAINLHKEGIKEIGVKINAENGMQVAVAYSEIANHYMYDKKNVQAAIRNMSRSVTLAESFFGWAHPRTAQLAYQLTKMYLENNYIDQGIILAEKTLVGLEIHQEGNDPTPITTVGAYLAKCYEKKKSVEMQQATISRTLNMLKRKQEVLDPQLYEESVFKLQNIMGACRFLLNETMIAATIYQKLNKTADKIMPEWLKRNPKEAQFELGYMKYFRGVSLIKLQRFDDGIKSIEDAVIQFERCGHNEWVEQAKINIKEASELKNKPPQEEQSQGQQQKKE